MIVAVSSVGKSMESELDAHFGRAAQYLIVDSETLKYSIIDNPAQNVSIGVGIAAAQTLIDRQVEAVITGQIGPNVLIQFSDARVQMYQGITGTVHDNIKAFRHHRLSVIKSSGPDHAAMRGV